MWSRSQRAEKRRLEIAEWWCPRAYLFHTRHHREASTPDARLNFTAIKKAAVCPPPEGGLGELKGWSPEAVTMQTSSRIFP